MSLSESAARIWLISRTRHAMIDSPWLFIMSSTSSKPSAPFLAFSRLSRDDHDVSKEPNRSEQFETRKWWIKTHPDTFPPMPPAVDASRADRQCRHRWDRPSTMTGPVVFPLLLTLRIRSLPKNRAPDCCKSINTQRIKTYLFAALVNLTNFVPLDIEDYCNVRKKNKCDQCCKYGGDDFKKVGTESTKSIQYLLLLDCNWWRKWCRRQWINTRRWCPRRTSTWMAGHSIQCTLFSNT